MKNGFTKIPNTLAELPLTIDAIGLYTWLSLRADKDGNIFTSRAKLAKETGLSEQQIRTAIEKLQTTKLITKLSTKLTTNLTICFLRSCKEKKIDSNQENNQVNDPPRANKNDNNKSCHNKTTEDTPLNPPKGENTEKRAKFKKPTIEEVRAYIFEKNYNIDAEAFWCYYEANGWVQGRAQKPIKNWKACVTTWHKNSKNYGTNQQSNPQASPNDIELLGQTHRIMQGFRAERLASQG